MMTAWRSVPAFDRVLDDVLGSAFGAATNPKTFEPAVDVRIGENEIVVVCDVPGVRQEDLEVTLENRVLTISGERKFERGEREHVALGRTYGAFKRAFTLTHHPDDAKLTADLTDGVLTVRIPKHPAAKARKITIGNGPDSGASALSE